MKKSLILLAIIILITGCNQKIQENNYDKTTINKKQNFHRPDFGQPEKTPDLVGIVKSIVGNEIILLEIEIPNRNQIKEKAENKPTNDKIKTQKPLGGGINIGGRGMGINRNEEEQQNMLEMLKTRSIAESTVTIPVGIRMLKPEIDSKTQEINTLEANLADIKKDQMLSIWLNQDVDERQIAEFVLIK